MTRARARLRVVAVKWLDASSIDTRWLRMRHARIPIKAHAHSYGILVRNDRKFLILAQSITDNLDDPSYSTFMEIPAKMVRKIQTLAWLQPTKSPTTALAKRRRGK